MSPSDERAGSYHGLVDGQFVRLRPENSAADPLAVLAHGQFRGMMLSQAYTCVGGASAVRRGNYRFGVFPELASSEAVQECADSLSAFLSDFPEDENPVAVFVASFAGPVIDSETRFETLLWQQLQGLHDMDSQPAWWNPERPDEWNDELGFLFSGRNFFVVGLHPAASRWSRRFAWPTLVFNSLSHMDPLVQAGSFERMQEKIRARDYRLQGSHNPSTERTQVAQFSGRAVDESWTCPLKPRSQG